MIMISLGEFLLIETEIGIPMERQTYAAVYFGNSESNFKASYKSTYPLACET